MNTKTEDVPVVLSSVRGSERGEEGGRKRGK